MSLHTYSLGDMIRDHARSWPSKLAFVDGDIRLTYAEVDQRVTRLANILRDCGVTAERPVLWFGQNSLRLLEGMLACAKLGAAFAPANWRQSPDELAHVLDDLSPAVVLWEGRDADLAANGEKARAQAAVQATWIQHDGDDADGYETLLTHASAIDEEVEVDSSLPVLLMYTAAFEGRPRAAMITHDGLVHQGLAIALVQGITWDSVYLNCGPLFHMATFMTTMSTLLLGATNVFTPTADAEDILRLVDAEHCTAAFLMPPTVQRMGELNVDGQYDLSSLATSRMGVAGFDEHISTVPRTPWLKAPGGFGQTEVTGLATFAAYGGPGMAGRSAPAAAVRILDPNGDEVAVGETGEIAVKGPLAMAGYWGDDAETRRRTRNGWLRTNDLGRRLDDGTIVFVAPMTRIIKSAAENIYPAEVESCLAAHPAVFQCCVIGVPDATWGQNVRAVVRLNRDAEPPSQDDLIAWCKDHIASYKKPKDVVFVDRFPRTALGVIDRDAVDAEHGGGGYPGNG